MTTEQVISVASLLVSLAGLALQGWALKRLKGTTHQVVRTASCRVACAIIYVLVGTNALFFNWRTLAVAFIAFCITQATWQVNAWLDVRLAKRQRNLEAATDL